jgi:hypothetical protein
MPTDDEIKRWIREWKLNLITQLSGVRSESDIDRVQNVAGHLVEAVYSNYNEDWHHLTNSKKRLWISNFTSSLLRRYLRRRSLRKELTKETAKWSIDEEIKLLDETFKPKIK